MDLEACSRRNNIRIIGLPESIEGTHPIEFFTGLLVEVLGDQVLTSTPELDRAHRALAANGTNLDQLSFVSINSGFETGVNSNIVAPQFTSSRTSAPTCYKCGLNTETLWRSYTVLDSNLPSCLSHSKTVRNVFSLLRKREILTLKLKWNRTKNKCNLILVSSTSLGLADCCGTSKQQVVSSTFNS